MSLKPPAAQKKTGKKKKNEVVGKYGTGWVTSCGAMAHKPACVSTQSTGEQQLAEGALLGRPRQTKNSPHHHRQMCLPSLKQHSQGYSPKGLLVTDSDADCKSNCLFLDLL